jgi:hypothetical protein
VDRTLVQAASPPPIAAFFDASDDEDMKESESVQPVPAVPLASGSDKDRLFVQAALPLLSMKRRTDYESWMKVGFAVSTVFGRDEFGRDHFRVWSQQAPNYDQGSCDKVYACAGKRVGLGSLITWLREDAPAPLVSALVQTLRDEEAEEREASVKGPSKLNEGRIHAMVKEHNLASRKRATSQDFQDKTVRAQKREQDERVDKLLADIVQYLNLFLCIIRRATGKPNIIEEYSRMQYGTDGSGEEVVTMFTLRSPSDAAAAYKKHSLHIEGRKGATTPMDIWLHHPEAREFDAIDFIPSASGHADGIFNLFRGLAITPAIAATCDGDVTPIVDHVHELWCKGNQHVTDFLLSWMSHLIQRPGVKMCTAPVLKGGQGAGKGIIVQLLGDILGAQHFMGVRNVEDVTGCFQEDKAKTNLLTFLDECTFAGDKRQSSVLKGLLTEKMRKWEAKFVNPVRIANHSNYIVASNYDQIVYVEEDDRRWFCIEVDSKYAGPQTPESKAYFDKLASVPAAAFARFLYERDISGFNPRAPPSTEYMRHQKVINFGSVTAYVEMALRRGRFTAGETFADSLDALNLVQDDREGDENMMQTPVLKTAVYDDYLVFCSERNIRRTAVDKAFWRKLRALVPSFTETRHRSVGRRRVLHFPSLKDARAQFLAAIHEADWDWEEVAQ